MFLQRERQKDDRIEEDLNKMSSEHGVSIDSATAADLPDELFSNFWTEDEINAVLQRMQGPTQ